MTHWIEKHSIHSEIAEATWSAHDPTWSYTHDLTFTADGSRVAAVDRAGTVRTFDTANGTLLSELSTGMSVRLGPGAAPGQVLAVGENRVFVLEADGSTRTSEGRFDRSRAEMLCVLALSDDLVVTGHRDGAIRRWSLAKGAVVRGQFKVKGSSAAVTDLTRTKDGGFLSVSAKVWKWSDDPKGAPELVHEHRRPLDGVFACGDDVFVTGSADVRAWFADGRSLELANSAGARVAACSNGLVYAAYPGRVFLYDYKSAEAVGSMLLPDALKIAASPDGRSLACGGDRSIALFPLKRTRGWSRRLPAITHFGSTATHCITGDAEGQVYLWSPATNLVEFALEGEERGPVHSVWNDAANQSDAGVSQSQPFRVAFAFGDVIEWYSETGYTADLIKSPRKSLSGVAAIDDQMLLTLSGEPAMWFAAYGASPERVEHLRSCANWSRSANAWLCTRSDTVLHVDPKTLEIIATHRVGTSGRPPGHIDGVLIDLKVSPDGESVLVRSRTQTHVFEVSEWTERCAAPAAEDAVWDPNSSDRLWVLRNEHVSELRVSSGDESLQSARLPHARRLAAVGAHLAWLNANGQVGWQTTP